MGCGLGLSWGSGAETFSPGMDGLGRNLPIRGKSVIGVRLSLCFSNMSHSCLACCFSPRHQVDCHSNLWPGSATDAVKKLLGEPLASDATILLRTPASRCALLAPACTRKQTDTKLRDAVLVLERCASTGVRGVSRLGQALQMLLQPARDTRNLT